MSQLRALPVPTPETAHFWQGAVDGKLLLQKCELNECGTIYFPPQPFCPACSSAKIALVEATGRATLHSFIISHLPAPGFDPPYVIAVVELEEGPRMLTNLVGCDPEPASLAIDMPLRVHFHAAADGVVLSLFEPAAQDAP